METLLRIVVFQIGTGYVGIDIRNIKEIVKGIHKPEISNSDPLGMVKVLHIQENIVPVLNLHEKFKTKCLLTDHTYFFIVSWNHKLLALPGDSIDRYYDVSFQHLHPLPYFICNMDTQYFQSIAKIGDMLVPLLNVEWLFHETGVI